MAMGSATEEKPRKQSRPSDLLGPGFRFHPTDEELVRYYLRRKVCGKGFRIDAISEVDIYKIEPWDLPSYSKLKTRDLEWYYFSVLDKKYGNGVKTNRATVKGYWKTTGKDRAVYHKTQIVGMKKTLVYHIGRAPKGQRTHWVMHEYRLVDLELERAGIAQEAFVLCRVFQKSGSRPKNGEQYGAPFVEEEWEDDESEFNTKMAAAEEVDFGDDLYLDANDLEQILGAEVQADTTIPLNRHSSDGSSGEEVRESINDTLQLSVDACEQYNTVEQLDSESLYDTHVHPYDIDVNQVKSEYIGESSKSGNFDDVDYLLDEPVLDSSSKLQLADGFFLDANNDFSTNSIETTNAFDMVDEYLSLFDSNDENLWNLDYDLSMILGNDTITSDQALHPQKEQLDEGTRQGTLPGVHLADDNSNDSAAPFNKLDCAQYEPEFEYPFIKQASQMLSTFSAPPAFASEFPSKDTVRHLNSLSGPSSSAHVTAGIQIRNLNYTVGSGREQLSLMGKSGLDINVVLSFGFSQSDDGITNLDSSASIISGKSISLLSRGWFSFLFLWVLFISVSLKLGACILAK